MQYTFDQLREMFVLYEEALWSPSRTSVRYGCDCGCGGDSYTSERWDMEEQQAQDAIDTLKAFCADIGVEYDGIE